MEGKFLIRFTGKPKKIGNSYFILVPMDYIDNGIIDKDMEYEFFCSKIKCGDSSDIY